MLIYSKIVYYFTLYDFVNLVIVDMYSLSSDSLIITLIFVGYA